MITDISVSAGCPGLQGATQVNDDFLPASHHEAVGVNFAVYAPDASQLYLCLFSPNDGEQRLEMMPSDQGVWHLLVKGIDAGQLYGFRADGAWSPSISPRFNTHKLLMDPYAREIRGTIQWCEELFDYQWHSQSEDNAYKVKSFSSADSAEQWLKSEQDSSAFVPRSVVREHSFDWQSVKKPGISRADSIVYELHVKGFTEQHPDVPEELRGTYLGLCHPSVIEYLKGLGVTAVELLPVTSLVNEERLDNMGLRNYWGYNPLCMMAPEPSMAIKDPVTEMKTMVRELHRAGIEVIMDVVYNHTCESGHGGPSLSMRGLAESDYYLMDDHNGRLSAVNYTGCGNTLNFDSPQTLKLTMDALRLWAEEYQIDGFRFDLAPTLARQHRAYQYDSAFFRAAHQDPVVSRTKLIAEPWDIGPEGYRLSGFPGEWQEWSDRFRDGTRAYWRGDDGRLAEMGWRITGSEDVFGKRRSLASINYLCSHDGFTLNDLCSYEERRNHANGEDNRDGDQHNFSRNYGVEGETEDRGIRARRLRARKNMLATLMLSRGTPMLMAGDEFGNSQQGNNNAYCQDSPLSWQDWSWMQDREGDSAVLQSFVQQLITFRKTHDLLGGAGGRKATTWYSPDGSVLTEAQLGELGGGCLCIKMVSMDANEDERSLYILINNEQQPRKVTLPQVEPHKYWTRLLDTSSESPFSKEALLTRGWFEMEANSLVVIEEHL
ncbi:MAG: glycogen debranching protein GlgX [Endozoicomonas sp.]|uniref:glycogen debranching protein GlgX n=1 Tax=Endozoicomonas sp. TaxID=1892382 RepID=UPI003D9B1C27